MKSSTKNNLKIHDVIRLELFDFFARFFVKKISPSLPKKIANLHLVEKIRDDDHQAGNLGIYKSTTMKQYFGKLLGYRYRNVQYMRFKNEMTAYKIISKYLSKKQKKLNKYSKVIIPEFFSVAEKRNAILMLIEYVRGKSLRSLPTEKKIDAYLTVSETLHEIGTSLSEKEKDLFPKRSGMDYFMMYPFFLLLAMLRHPEYWRSLAKGAIIYLKNVGFLRSYKQLVLSHRDLHLKNILVQENNLVLLDFELCGYTLPLVDEVITLQHEWSDTAFSSRLLQEIELSKSNEKYCKPYFSLLIVLVCTQALTAIDYSKQDLDMTNSFLNYGLRYSKRIQIKPNAAYEKA